MAVFSEIDAALNIIDKVRKNKMLSNIYYKLKKVNYYFTQDIKEVDIDGEGNGIITHKIEVCVVDPKARIEIKRSLNIEDAKKDVSFIPLTEMMKCDISEAGKKLGFWYTATQNVVQLVSEKYCDYMGSPGAKNNSRELQWEMLLDNSKLNAGHIYTILYVISIPGMYPMSKGFRDPDVSPDEAVKDFSSQMKISHLTNEVIYKLNLSADLKQQITPCGTIVFRGLNNSNKEEPIKGYSETNLRTNTYIFKKEKPEFGSIFRIKWTLKDKQVENKRVEDRQVEVGQASSC